MDNKYNYQSPTKTADADIHNQDQHQSFSYDFYPNEGSSSTSSQPSAPPQSEFTPLVHDRPPQYYQVPQQQYQAVQMPTPQHYTQPAPSYSYIIRKRGADGRQFPVQASIFLLGCLAPPIWFIACCWPTNNRYEIAWRKANYCMIGLFIIGFTLFVILMTLLMLEDGGYSDPDPEWRIPQIFSYFSS